MTTKKNAAAPAAEKLDPTLPYEEIVIDGQTYKMCFDFRAMAKGDAKLRAAGVDSRLLWQMPQLTLENLPIVFAASLVAFHPEISFEDAIALVDWDTIFELRDKVIEAWSAAFPKRGKQENPPKPVPS